jgi:hypothetical protein
MDIVSSVVGPLQSLLNFEGSTNKQFIGNATGKIGTTGFLLGVIGGFHFGVWILLCVLYFTDSANEIWSSSLLLAVVIYLLFQFHSMVLVVSMI